MNRLLFILGLWFTGLLSLSGQQTNALATTIQFQTMDVFVDSGSYSLAAYQLTVEAKSGNVRIVGIEGGAHPAFAEPPHYDPKAMQQDRVILAAFSTAASDNLPSGRTRVATIHVQVTGNDAVEFALKLTAAGTVGGGRITANATIENNEQR